MAVKKTDLKNIEDLERVAADDGVRFFSATHEEIRKGHVTDIYFLKTLHILRAEGLDRTVAVADIHTSADGVLAGVEEVRRLLRGLSVRLSSPAGGERMSRGETGLWL